MTLRPSPIAALLAAYKSGQTDPIAQARLSQAHANSNASRNTYIALDPQWTLTEAQRQTDRVNSAELLLPLYSLPVSLKDCFDLTGFPTSSGSKFYAAHKQNASSDSWVAARLRSAGAVITGKTHLHQLAYGITGENRDYGDCLQPANPSLLTGGSSSGAAASIQEGSAIAAIGTDTGGSIRAPAALCGLTGYRASLGVGDWAGGHHLAPSFDTIGWLCRPPRPAPACRGSLRPAF
jgi:aspartyl-tRNA(Asn)/glutamyl-tRNA(Gln) amidotransferase subunit A